MAAPKGFEPLLTGSEPVVLPLYERAIFGGAPSGTRTRDSWIMEPTAGFEPALLVLLLLQQASSLYSTSTKSSALPAELTAHSSILSLLAWLAGCF